MKKLILILGFGLIISTVFYSCNIKIDGSLSYDDISISSGDSGSSKAKWSGEKASEYKLEYSIDGGTGISIDKSSGEVSVSSSAAVQSKSYTITAKGTNNTEGEKKGSIKITVGYPTLAYADMGTTTTFGTAKTSGVSTTINTEYSFKSTLTTGTNILAGKITIANDGKITITKDAEVKDSGTYKVIATKGDGTTKTTYNVVITITPKAIVAGDVVYTDITAKRSEALDATTATKGKPTLGTGVTTGTFAVMAGGTALPAGLSLDATNGNITGTTTLAGTTAVTYKITVTGTGNYMGSVDVDVKITPAD